jgi:hypothetical protein
MLGKKLKKRFEDLERRAADSGSEKSSTSSSSRKKDTRKQKPRAASTGSVEMQQPVQTDFASMSMSDSHQVGGFLSLPDEPIFLDQYAKTMSLSPPPTFAYPPTTMDSFQYSPYTSSLAVGSMTATDASAYGYQHAISSPYPSPVQNVDLAVKPNVYGNVGLAAYNMSFAHMPNVQVTAGQFGDHMPQVNHLFPSLP